MTRGILEKTLSTIKNKPKGQEIWFGLRSERL
jgi:hypothetical protein